MVVESWMVATGAGAGGLMIGLAAGALVAQQALGKRFDARMARHTQKVSQQQSATLDKLRASQSMAQSELEHLRGNLPKQVAAAVAEHRAQVIRLEDRLKATYAELDNLRSQAAAPARPVAERPNGFAATMPMESRF
jgi:uncharacterized coiled-coil protein SlyX